MVDLSLIIPCHNLKDYIQPCLDSLVSQRNRANISREVIFICDNCTDNTHELIEDTMSKSNWNYIIIDIDVRCAGYSRNEGLNLAKGKYIWFIDGDDWLTCDNAIDTVYQECINYDLDICEFKIKSKANPNGVFGGGTVWRAMLSRRVISDTKFNNRLNGEDNDFSYEVWNKPNARYKKIDFAPYFYNYPRKDSLSDKAYHVWRD